MSLAAVRDLRDARSPAGKDELAAFETDVLAGFVLARAAAGLADATIRSDVSHLEQLRAWFGRPLQDMVPADADAYFGTVLRDAAKGTRLGRSQALRTYFLFLPVNCTSSGSSTGRQAWSVERARRGGGRTAWTDGGAGPSANRPMSCANVPSTGLSPRILRQVHASVRGRRPLWAAIRSCQQQPIRR